MLKKLKRKKNQLTEKHSKKNVQLPCMMWTDFYNKNLLGTLAYYVQMRRLYKHPILYNTSKRQLAEKMGISLNALKFHLNILTEEKVVQFRDGHIFLSGSKTLNKLYPSKGVFITGKCVTATSGETLAETKILLRSISVISVLKMVYKHVQKEFELETLKNRAGKFDLGAGVKRKLDAYEAKGGKKSRGQVCISNKGIAKHSGRKSETTGRKYKKIWQKAGLMEYRRKYVIIPEKERHLYHDETFGFLKGAFLFGYMIVREVMSEFKLPNRDYLEIPKGVNYLKTYTKQQLKVQNLRYLSSGTIPVTYLTSSIPAYVFKKK